LKSKKDFNAKMLANSKYEGKQHVNAGQYWTYIEKFADEICKDGVLVAKELKSKKGYYWF
jgi:hypothetical protein